MASSLTAGGIADISNNKTVTKPIFQVVELKKINAVNQTNTQDRYRLILSDGQHYMQAMLATQLNKYVHNDELKLFSIIQANEFLCNHLNQQKKILILIGIQVIDNSLSEKIGNPVHPTSGTPFGEVHASDPVPSNPVNNSYNNNTNNTSNNTANNNQRGGAPQRANFQQPAQSSQYAQQQQQQQHHQQQQNVNTGSGDEPVFPISVLNPYQSRWTIKARVARKSMRDYTNQKGPGKILTVDLVDGNGEIRCTAFNDLAINLDRIFEENNIYYVSKGQIKFANKKFNTLSNEYEITFDSNTTVMPCNDDPSIPKANYNFKPIANIVEMEKDALVDVIGVIKELDESASPVTLKDGRVSQKRSVFLADESDASIKLTLWGAKAEDPDLTVGLVLAVKGAKVSDFGGKSLTFSAQSSVEKSPDRPDTFRLLNWFKRTGGEVNHVLSQAFQPSSSGTLPRKSFQQAREENIQPNQTFRFASWATVTSVKEKDEFWYAACPGRDPNDPTRECNKKILPLGQQWTCEKCNGSFDRPKYRYIVSLRCSDHTGSLWFTAFNEVAEKILQVDADSVIGWKQSGLDEQVTKVFKLAAFQPFNMRIMAKADVYNDDTKIKYTIQSVSPINYVERSRELLSQIKALANN